MSEAKRNPNSVYIRGIVGRDAKIGTSQKGKAFCFLNIGVQPYAPKEGKPKPETDWFTVSAWEDNAHACEGIQKGDIVEVEGQFRSHKKPTDQKTPEGKPIYIVEWTLNPKPNGIRKIGGARGVRVGPAQAVASDDYDPWRDE